MTDCQSVPQSLFLQCDDTAGETDHYSVEDHVDAICHHAFADAVDIVVANNCCFSQSILDKYNAMGRYAGRAARKGCHPYIH